MFLHFFRKTIAENKKPRFKIGDKVRIPMYDILFRKGYKSQFTSEIFQIVKIATLKPPTYDLYGEHDEILGKFWLRAWKVYRLEINSSTVVLFSNASFDCYPNKILFFYKFSFGTDKSWRMGCCN